jgi:phenylalanyl-tRNA synthetase beta subunit
MADCAIYTTVSTYNSTHVYQYNFVSAAEKQAYQRAADAIATKNVLSVPDYVCRD